VKIPWEVPLEMLMKARWKGVNPSEVVIEIAKMCLMQDTIDHSSKNHTRI